MDAHSVKRKLAAIVAADVAGYSRLMERDEVGTLHRLTAYRSIIDQLIASYRGRIYSRQKPAPEFFSPFPHDRSCRGFRAMVRAQ